MRDRVPPKGFASAAMYELIFCRRDPASRMNSKLGSCTAFSYRSLFSVNRSLLLFFARSLKNVKNSGVKYFDFSAIGYDLLSRDIAFHRLNIDANGRASKTARTEAIFSPRTRYHSQMNAVPAGVFVTMSYNRHTSSPSTDERLLRLHAGDDVVELPQGLQIRLRFVERLERTHERQIVVQVPPCARKVSFPQCFLIRHHNLFRIRHSLTLRRQCGSILPRRQARTSVRAEPANAPHA